MKALVRREWPLWTMLATMFLAAALVWPLAPEKMPIHWNAQDQIDAYGGKFLGLFLLPLCALGVYLLMLLLPRIDPGRENYEAFSKAFVAMRATILVVLAVIYAAMLLIAFGVPLAIHQVILPALGVLFLVIGNYLGKIRPNWFVGIRTPWTLSSKLSWIKTHRLGGWVFVGMGLICIVAAFLPGPWSAGTLVASVILVLLILTPYSYFVWRHDPERIPPAGTGPAEP